MAEGEVSSHLSLCAYMLAFLGKCVVHFWQTSLIGLLFTWKPRPSFKEDPNAPWDPVNQMTWGSFTQHLESLVIWLTHRSRWTTMTWTFPDRQLLPDLIQSPILSNSYIHSFPSALVSFQQDSGLSVPAEWQYSALTPAQSPAAVGAKLSRGSWMPNRSPAVHVLVILFCSPTLPSLLPSLLSPPHEVSYKL